PSTCSSFAWTRGLCQPSVDHHFHAVQSDGRAVEHMVEVNGRPVPSTGEVHVVAEGDVSGAVCSLVLDDVSPDQAVGIQTNPQLGHRVRALVVCFSEVCGYLIRLLASRDVGEATVGDVHSLLAA